MRDCFEARIVSWLSASDVDDEWKSYRAAHRFRCAGVGVRRCHIRRACVVCGDGAEDIAMDQLRGIGSREGPETCFCRRSGAVSAVLMPLEEIERSVGKVNLSACCLAAPAQLTTPDDHFLSGWSFVLSKAP